MLSSRAEIQLKLTARSRPLSWPILAAMVVSPLLVDCGAPGNGRGKSAGAPKCPDPSDPAAIWAASFGLAPEMDRKIKSALSAWAELQRLAAVLERDFVAACSGLARDLGATDDDLRPTEDGPGKAGEHACNVATKWVGRAKDDAKAAAGSISIKLTPSVCSVSMDVAAACAASCNGGPAGDKVEVLCKGGEVTGRCDGWCSATCDTVGPAPCAGGCSGTCSVPLKNPTCSGHVVAPGAPADCAAMCSARIAASASCTAGRATVSFSGDATAGAVLARALEKHLPKIQRVKGTMEPLAAQAAADVKASVEEILVIAKTDANLGRKVGPCVALSLKATISASDGIRVLFRENQVRRNVGN